MAIRQSAVRESAADHSAFYFFYKGLRKLSTNYLVTVLFMFVPKKLQLLPVVISARRSSNCVLFIVLLFVSKNKSAIRVMLSLFIISSQRIKPTFIFLFRP